MLEKQSDKEPAGDTPEVREDTGRETPAFGPQGAEPPPPLSLGVGQTPGSHPPKPAFNQPLRRAQEN